MDVNSTYRPRLRPVEAFRLPPDDGESGYQGETIGLRDATGLSHVILTMSEPALRLLTFVDGTRTCDEVLAAYQDHGVQSVSRATLDEMLTHLERAMFLEGPTFETHYAGLVEAYQAAPARTMPQAAALGVDATGHVFEEMLAGVDLPTIDGLIRGVIAPHLDYARGAPCYAITYGLLKARPVPDRVIILGTNHFGRSTSVVATGKDFDTPLGLTHTDVGFIERLERRIGPLRTHELDHAREHSVELQVPWLQQIYGAEAFHMVPVLCPDPCGPTGTAPYDGQGVDLRDFAHAIKEEINSDDTDTLIVAGADLSHVGANFGDDRPLDEAFLAAVAEQDQSALASLVEDGAEAFVDELKARDNETRVCSAGCMFTAATVLGEATVRVCHYHQAVDRETQTCVTCTAAVFT